MSQHPLHSAIYDLIISIYVIVILDGVGLRIRICREIDDAERNTWADVLIVHEHDGMRFILMLLYPRLAPIGFGFHVYGDAETVKTSLTYVMKHEERHLVWFLYTYATVRYGTMDVVEGTMVVGIVKIDTIVVGKAEDDTAE